MDQIISDIFSQYAYSPLVVHFAMWFFMILSAFGLPLPEEIVLVSVGFVGYMSIHPQLYPPPYAGASGANVYLLALSAFFAVIASDYLIYFLGQTFGPALFKMRWFARLVNDTALARIQRWTRRYGYWAVVVFRFTPGIRFPGHLMCGAMKLKTWRYLTIDIIAAGISVPTQVLLVCFYGNYILKYFHQFKIYVVIAVILTFATVFSFKQLKKRRALAYRARAVTVDQPSAAENTPR
jgi:membrane protein DedA with SNARE-associated domain